MQPANRPRFWRRVRAITIALAVSLLLAELIVRWLVLADSGLARSLGARLRRAGYFADSNADDAYWKLACRFDHAQADAAALADPLLGWRNDKIEAVTHAHEDAAKVGQRRVVLLYGDSFAEGVTAPEDSFQGLLERSSLTNTHVLLNYGVGGYGVDQMLLLARDTLDDWKDHDPVALAAILVDNDLERCVLGFRSGPKPLFRLRNGMLVDPERVETNVPRFLDAHPIGITSYLGRLVCHAPGVLPRGVQSLLLGDVERLDEKQALGHSIVRALCRELRAHSKRPALVLMHGRAGLRAGADWRERLILGTALEEGVAVIETRPALLRAVEDDPARIDSLYIRQGPGAGHMNRLGNQVVFEALRAFVEGRPPETALHVIETLQGQGVFEESAPRILERELLGSRMQLSYSESDGTPCFAQPRDAAGHLTNERIGLRAGNLGPTSLRWWMPAGVRRLRARVHAVGGPADARGSSTALLQIARRTGPEKRESEELALPVGEAPREWSVEFEPGWLELRLDPPAGGAPSLWVLLEAPVLERD